MDPNEQLAAIAQVVRETDMKIYNVLESDRDARGFTPDQQRMNLWAQGYYAVKAIVEGDQEPKKEVGRGVRPKYVDEHFPRWMKFGGWVKPNDKVGDVNDGCQDVVHSVSEEVADKLIQARDAFVDRLQEIFDEHPDQFHVYGPPLK